MSFLADLHTHSTASDGQYTPTQLVGLAKQRGLEVLALTDHDTMDGLDEAIREGERLGLRVIRGVELGASEHRNLHLLGYGFSAGTSELSNLCQTMKRSRDERKYRIVDFLAEKGVPVSLEEVEALAGGSIISRPHFAQVMAKRGYVATTREAFDRYLDTEEYQKIERFKADARTCIGAIKASGGMACLAHPYQLGYSEKQLEALVGQLKEYGLDAMECYYPRHTREQTEFYLSLCRKYELYVTGGSDFHGENIKPDISLACVDLNLDWADRNKR